MNISELFAPSNGYKGLLHLKKLDVALHFSEHAYRHVCSAGL